MNESIESLAEKTVAEAVQTYIDYQRQYMGVKIDRPGSLIALI